MEATIPSFIIQATNKVLQDDPWFADSVDCEDTCVMASKQLIDELKAIGISGAKMIGDFFHAWVYVDGWNIDLTARQFDKDAPCPKIWNNLINLS